MWSYNNGPQMANHCLIATLQPVKTPLILALSDVLW